MSIAGNIDCPCINTTQEPFILARKNITCPLDENGASGYRGIDNICYPITYGTDTCAKHDKMVRADCKSLRPPEYCEESWCYIDKDACKLSKEQYFVSDIFTEVSGLYYSYSTCNSSHDAWKDFQSTSATKDKNLTVVIPNLWYPKHYKISKVDRKRTNEYYNNTRWTGWLINYFDDVIKESNINTVTYTFQSKGSNERKRSDGTTTLSEFTSAVYDIQAGIADMALSNFWITSERLELAPFSAPLAVDKIYLFTQKIPSNLSNNLILGYLKQTLEPFDVGVWILAFFVFMLVGFLKIVFDGRKSDSRYWYRLRDEKWKKANYLHRIFIFCCLAFESCLYESAHALGGGVSVAYENTLAQKLVYTGFSFFLLTLISAYTANLAAVLTVQRAAAISSIKNIDDAISKGVKICTFPGLQEDLEKIYLRPNQGKIFEYFEGAVSLGEEFKKGKCEAIISSYTDLEESEKAMEIFCELHLQITGPSVLEKYTAFPVSSKFSAGISHWIYEAEKKGISYSNYYQEKLPVKTCGDFGLSQENADTLQSSSLTIGDFALPIVVMVGFTGLATYFHLNNVDNSWREKEESAVDSTDRITN